MAAVFRGAEAAPYAKIHWYSLQCSEQPSLLPMGREICGRNDFLSLSHTIYEVRKMKEEKEEEKKPSPWILKDPKPPVIQSGHMENQRR